MQIAYFSYPGVDGRYFRCDRYGTMSTAACSRNFQTAPSVVRDGRLGGCIGCDVGLQHSGGAVAKSAGSALSGFCVRCRRPPSDYQGSGVGRVRLVRDGVCVSCANREYEVLKGRDAKGNAPTKWAGLLGPNFTGLVRDGGSVDRVDARLAVDKLELGLAAMRRDPSVSALCWVSLGVLPPADSPVYREQVTLFEGPSTNARPLRAAPRRAPPVPFVQPDLFEDCP